jgi:hypothetical protein
MAKSRSHGADAPPVWWAGVCFIAAYLVIQAMASKLYGVRFDVASHSRPTGRVRIAKTAAVLRRQAEADWVQVRPILALRFYGPGAGWIAPAPFLVPGRAVKIDA